MSIQKKALLVGSSFSAAPIFFSLKKHNLHVSVCGKLESDPCHQYSDDSFFIDYSDPAQLHRIIENNKFDYLIPTCNDYSYMSCAEIAEDFGFPGFDKFQTASILHTKNKFRQITKRLEIPSPQYHLLDENTALIQEINQFPLLVKPTDSFSGRGMTKVECHEDLETAIHSAFSESRKKQSIVLEQFVEGTLHSHSAFIQDEKIITDFFVDEFCTIYPYQVDCSNHPSNINDSIRRQVRDSISKLIKSLKLTDGLLHTQFICSQEQFWIIETMRRCPGDLYGSLIAMSTGINYSDLFIRPYLGLKIKSLNANPPLFFARHTVSSKESLINISFSCDIPKIKNLEIIQLKNSGEYLKEAPFDKLAIIFAEFPEYNAMHEITSKMAEFIHIRKYET